MKHISLKLLLILCVLINCGCSKQEPASESDRDFTLTAEEETSDYTSSGYDEESSEEETSADEEISTEDEEYAAPSPSLSQSNIIDVKPLCQYPELATGCEITSLTAVLNYYGYNVDKCSLSDDYLEKGPVGETDFRLAFEGDPRDGNSYGCYAPVIKNTANKYLSAQNSSMYAKDITGGEFEELFDYIDRGIPVIVWGTLDCREGHYSVTWNVDGKDLTWFTPEHCMVLIGYESDTVTVCDPTYGDIRSYDRELFKSRYNSLQKQAVVIIE